MKSKPAHLRANDPENRKMPSPDLLVLPCFSGADPAERARQPGRGTDHGVIRHPNPLFAESKGEFYVSVEIVGWLIALIAFAIAEGATAQLVSLWFVGGSLAALIAAICAAPLWLQFTLFVGVSVLLLLSLRPLLRKYLKPYLVPTNADRCIRKSALVQERIDNLASTGRVRVEGMDWAARSVDGSVIEAGEQVTVCRIEGVRLFVERQTVVSGKG